ncbi:MAG: DUF262 domain-containing protein [candidate division Zixibacteria bacterium]|nr:DUF262 domain-containing protein [candidate division Zixibacteria bacterium]
MPKQKVPDIEFNYFVLAQIKDLLDSNKIFINPNYQRSDMWTYTQQVELIRSITKRYSIGVLVLFINDRSQYEILDGQQRLLTIKKYVDDDIDLSHTDLLKYSDLEMREKALIDAYCIYYLKLKSHDIESKEEDIIQTFLRLQEGTPLNKAEKINAYRGKFKNTFREIRDTNKLFAYFGRDKRFRLRLLCAELLMLELESNFENQTFLSLDIDTFKDVLKKYEKDISERKVKFFKGNLDFLHTSLNYLLTAIQPRELVPFYLLVSYLRRHKADNSNLMNELSDFAEQFLGYLNMFSIYDKEPPEGMSIDLFEKYMNYKTEARKATTADSIKYRFNFILEEFKRLQPFIQKDKQRLLDIEQKRILFFRQKGICPECNQKIDFRKSSAHHVIAHRDGAKTEDLDSAALLHEKCHRKLEKKLGKIFKK